jgi:hypothetical protein
MNGHIGEYNRADGFIKEYHRADAFDFRYADDEYDCYNDPDVIAGRVSLDECEEKHSASSSERSRFDKWMDGINRVLDVGDRSADLVHKLKNDGTQTEVDGVQYDTTLGQKEQPKTDMSGWYIAGGVIVLLVIAGVVIKNRN